MVLRSDSYGKARVRIMRVQRGTERHEVRELTVKAMLQGDFSRAYTDADNRLVVATDTIKNIVNIVARENVAVPAEILCHKLADRFLERYSQVAKVVIDTTEMRWLRMVVGGEPHPHGFALDANGTPTVRLERSRTDSVMRSGIAGFTFMKTTGSGWANYVLDDCTTLPETTDRIAATSMIADWLWSALPADPEADNALILQTLLAVFAGTYSHSIQDSLYRMGEAALAAVPAIEDIKLACPNRHYVAVDLSRFGISADDTVFTSTDEPHGQIECTIARR